MKKLLLVVLLALMQSPVNAQIISYDFEEGDGIFSNKGTLDSAFDLKGAVSVRGADKSGVGGHGRALDLTGALEMGGAGGLEVDAISKDPFPAQKAMTVTGWFKTPDDTPNDGTVFVRTSGREPPSGFLVGATSDGRLNTFIGCGETFLNLTSEKGAFAEVGKWVFFAVTWDGETGNWAWYVGSENDKLREAGAGTKPGTMVDGQGGLKIGRANSGMGAFKGWLDHLQVYDRALSESEVEKIRSTQASGH